MEEADVRGGSGDCLLSERLHSLTPHEEAVMKIYRKFHTHAIKGTFPSQLLPSRTQRQREHGAQRAVCIIDNHQLHCLVLLSALISRCYLSVNDITEQAQILFFSFFLSFFFFFFFSGGKKSEVPVSREIYIVSIV